MNSNILLNKKLIKCIPTHVSNLKFSISNFLLKKPSDKDEFITMVSSKKIQSSKDRLYAWGYAGTGALGNFCYYSAVSMLIIIIYSIFFCRRATIFTTFWW